MSCCHFFSPCFPLDRLARGNWEQSQLQTKLSFNLCVSLPATAKSTNHISNKPIPSCVFQERDGESGQGQESRMLGSTPQPEALADGSRENHLKRFGGSSRQRRAWTIASSRFPDVPKVLLRSQSGLLSGLPFTCCPKVFQSRFDALVLRVLLLSSFVAPPSSLFAFLPVRTSSRLDVLVDTTE